MFNTIIQPTGIYNTSQIKPQALQKTPEPAGQNLPDIVQENNTPNKNTKKKTGIAVKLVLLTFAAIGVIWGLPALKNSAANKQKGLIARENEILKKEEELLKKGQEALEKEKRTLQKEAKALERDKKIFEKMDNSPILSKAKRIFIKAANFTEHRIQRPIQDFFAKHIFSFVKK